MIKNRDQNRLNVVYVHASSIANQQINRFVQTQTLIKKSNVSLCFQGILTVSCILHNYWCQVDSVTYKLIVTSARFSIAGDQLYYWEVVFFSACALSLCCVQVLASFFRAFLCMMISRYSHRLLTAWLWENRERNLLRCHTSTGAIKDNLPEECKSGCSGWENINLLLLQVKLLSWLERQPLSFCMWMPNRVFWRHLQQLLVSLQDFEGTCLLPIKQRIKRETSRLLKLPKFSVTAFLRGLSL